VVGSDEISKKGKRWWLGKKKESDNAAKRSMGGRGVVE